MATGKRTFLAAQHERRGAKLIDFALWQLPVQFEGVLAEHRHCRTACAVFDTCHMGQFHFSGRDAAGALAGLLSRDITSQPVGSSWYSLLLNEQAGILDDTILLRLAETEFLLIVNGATRQSDLQWIRSHVQGQVDIAEQADWGKLDVQGPASARVLAGWMDFDIANLEYFHCRTARCLGHPCVIGRSGYTGELGYEIFMPAPALSELYERLLAHELVKPAGLGARDLLRLEMGYPLYGHDIDTTTDPLEADLMAFVAMGHDFIGRLRLIEIARQGPSRRRVAFICNGRARPDAGSAILIKTQHTGTVTSGGFSPSLQAAIGMGYVALDAAAVGNALTIDTGKRTILATVSAKPLYPLGTCRTPLPLAEIQHGS